MIRAPSESIGDLLKDAAYDPSAWPLALEGIDTFLDSSGVVLLSVDERVKYAPCSPNIDEMMEDYFHSGWHSRDLRENCVPLLRKRGFVIDSHFLDIEDIESTDYYQEFLRRHRQKWFAGVSVAIGDEFWCLAIQRSKDKEAFQDQDIKKLKHVQALLSVSAAATSRVSRSWVKGALNALQGIGEAAFVLDWRGKVVHINEAAQRLIGGCIDRAGRVKLPDLEATKIIDDFVVSCKYWRANPSPLLRTPPFLIGKQYFSLETIVLSSEPALAFASGALLGRLVPFRASPIDVLRQEYSLTSGESRIATSLYQGKDVKRIAELFQISENTVRTHLKNIFHKTATGSQSQFVALVLSISLK